jgi:membrane-associated phospholipid phosphatase
MENLRNIGIHKKVFWLFWAIFLISGLVIIWLTDQHELHRNINAYHHPFWDTFFKYATYLGDGMLFPIVIVGLLIFKRKWATAFIYAGLLSLVLSYVFKRYVFGEHPRPYEVFGNTLHLIEGVKMKKWHSFPSGHTLSAFAMFTLAVFFAKKYTWQLLWFSLAVIAGLSRVYLSQHFVEDILGGAFIGSMIAILGYFLWNKYPIIKR